MATSSTGEKVLEVETLQEELVRAKNIQGDLEQIVDAYEEKVQNVSKQLATNEEQLATSEERLKGVLPQHFCSPYDVRGLSSSQHGGERSQARGGPVGGGGLGTISCQCEGKRSL